MLSDVSSEKTNSQINFLNTQIIENQYDELIVDQFRRFFISYTRNFNYIYKRTGSLFSRQFKRVLVEDQFQLKYLYYYVHHNPIKHKISLDFKNYKWSSYPDYLKSVDNQLLSISEGLLLFDGIRGFVDYHDQQWEKSPLNEVFFEL